MVPYSISHLASAIAWWLNYISSVGREYVIAESSLKIPASEYLERYYRESIELEYNHPHLSQKRFDLYFRDDEKEIENAFELKFVREDSTRALAERKRIFNDLMRLHLFLDASKRGYFLICGNQLHFKTSFKHLDLDRKAPIVPKTTASAPVIPGFFSEWFSFDPAHTEKTIDLNNQDDKYKKIYDAFMNDYEDAYLEATKKNLIKPNSIKTKLRFLSEELTASHIPQTFSIGIWEVVR